MTEQEKSFPEHELLEARKKIIATNTVVTKEEIRKLKGVVGKTICDRFVRKYFDYQILFGWKPSVDIGQSSFILEDFSLIADQDKMYLVFLTDGKRNYFPRFGLGNARTLVSYEFTTSGIYLQDSGDVLWSFSNPTDTYLYRGKELIDSDFPAVLKIAQSFMNFENLD